MFLPVYFLILHSTEQHLLQLYPVNGEQRSQSSFRNLSEDWSLSADWKGFDGGIHHPDALSLSFLVDN